MAVEPLILIANPGSASRKYALYKGTTQMAHLHFEYDQGRVVCGLQQNDETRPVDVQLENLPQASRRVLEIFKQQGIIVGDERIEKIGLRVVAPSAYFLQDRLIDDEVLHNLEGLQERAPIHIQATLEELYNLRNQFNDVPVYGLSDSSFHSTKPDFAWNYGLPINDADRFDIKRYGFHGLSVASAVNTLHKHEKLPPRMVVCHLGSGVSITAVYHGKSLDTTMGYSPLEGAVMGTRVGNIDPTAVRVLQRELGMDDYMMQQYLNQHSGLKGLSGLSSDIRELLQHEAEGSYHAGLALNTYVHSIQKAIGQMINVLGGCDVLVFTGTVGERSAPIRERILQKMHYLDFVLDGHTNRSCTEPQGLTCISRLAHSRPIFVIPANETLEMVQHLLKI